MLRSPPGDHNRDWVMRLPLGLRDQPAWVFIGALVALAGVSYLIGIAESTSITRVLDPTWLRVWGGFQAVSGTLIVVSTVAANKPLERLSLRLLSLGILIYIGWILAAIPLSRAAFTVALCLAFVGLAEIRVAVLKAVLRPLPTAAVKALEVFEEGERQ